jgi:protein-disulfide isomerase
MQFGFGPLAALALGATLAAGCGDGRGAAVDDETLSKRVVTYYEKTITQPGVGVRLVDIREADIPGWRKANVEASLGGQTRKVPILVSSDGRFMMQGEVVDLTVDPLEAVMGKIAMDDQPVRGPADAKVTIVEYSDFQCPFCRGVYETLENQVLKEYGDKVRFFFKHFPLTSIHPWAEDAALATECAYLQGNDAFWKLYDGLFRRQAEITRDNLRDKVLELAAASGLDTERLGQCYDSREALARVKADIEEATTLGVNSTPTFFVNGRRLTGAQTFESFKTIIEQQLG